MPDCPVKRALIAVYDKTGIAEFARALVDEFGVEIISTGGTAKHLKEAGIPVTLVEQVTGFPEMLDGRVKTLHPKIHAAILADRDNPEHMRQLAEQGIRPIDMVVVNLYPFEKTVADPECRFEDAIEMIDIGGPCLLRAAAKNHRHVLVVESIELYREILGIFRTGESKPYTLEEARRHFATLAFWETAGFDGDVSTWLNKQPGFWSARRGQMIRIFNWGSLRYGENPHQSAELYQLVDSEHPFDLTIADATPDAATELSFNNYADADAALGLCAELTRELSAKEPRASARAAVDARAPRSSPRAAVDARAPRSSAEVLSQPERNAPTWLVTWTTYGSWLPGDARGFVGRVPTEAGTHEVFNVPETPYSSDQRELEEAARERMKGDAVLLDAAQAEVVAQAIMEVSDSHQINVMAFAIMPNHVHVACQTEESGAELLQLLKGVSARRLGQAFGAPTGRWWTKSGSTRHLRPGDDPGAMMEYVCAQQGALVIRCCDAARDVGGAHSASDAARAEARGSLARDEACGSLARDEARGSLARDEACGSLARDEARGSLARDDVRGSLARAEHSAVAVFIKHTNACGVGVAVDPRDAYRRAYLGDPNAAMGGILAVNVRVDEGFARVVMETYDQLGKPAGAGGFFVEVWLAPQFDDAAVAVIRSKKKWGENVRLLAVGEMSAALDPKALLYRSIAGGMLVQTPDVIGLDEDRWNVVTKRAPTDSELSDLRLAWLVAKHTKSNAISICRDGMLIGNGAGQMSRVMSCRVATWLAKENGHADRLPGSVAASDAFFPFRDGPDLLIDAGVRAIIQPGGSKRDADTIAACDERDVAMIFTGTRHFRH